MVLPIRSKASTPFWIMNVGSSIIRDHGDVWNDAVVAMVKVVSDQNEHFNRVRASAANAVSQKSPEISKESARDTRAILELQR